MVISMTIPITRSMMRRIVTLAVAGTVALTGAVVSFTAGPAPSAQAAEGSPALTPPLGWNSWNTFYCNIDEGKIRGAADAMVSSGMRDAGYEYVVVDDCWQSPQRAADGSLQADPDRFPSGMKALGDYIHSKGLKFGIYQAPRQKTCAQFFGATPGATGAQGHERQDADTFAAWGVDYLKYDWCSDEGTLQEQIDAFTLMRDALRATGRDIVYSINPNSIRPNRGAEYDWGAIADMWRTTEDITAAWSSGCTADCFMGVTEILDVQAGLTSWNGPGHWNDPDMLEVGKNNILSPTENRAHFGMWALMGSPLIAGNDITTMNEDTRSILTNKDIIAVDQDELGLQAARVRDDGDVEIWSKRMSDGSYAVGLLNRGGSSVTVTTTAAQVGLSSAPNYAVSDLFTGGKSNSTGTLSASVPRHGLTLLRVAAGTVASTVVSLKGEQSGLCLDGEGGQLNLGTRGVVNTCDEASQTQRVALRDGQIMMGGMCLDVDHAGTANGTAVLFWECNSQINQQWVVQQDGSIRSTSSGKCLDVDNGGLTAGSELLIWECNGQSNQRWSSVTREAAAAPQGVLTASATPRCVSGRVVVVVSATNTGATSAAVSLSSPWGRKPSVDVASGKSVSQSFTTRARSIAASTVTAAAVTSTGDRAEVKAPVSALSC